MKKRSGIAGLRMEIWKLTGVKWGMEGKKSLICAGGIPCIAEMPKNINEARGAPEQQMAKHERDTSTQGTTHCLKEIFWYACI
jgi:hypothetical protein